jgi:hypothetical protein
VAAAEAGGQGDGAKKAFGIPILLLLLPIASGTTSRLFLQALENFCDLTLESWDHVFSQKLIFRLQFGDSAISTVYLHALRLRVDHPDEPDSSAEPLRNFVFNFVRSIIG